MCCLDQHTDIAADGRDDGMDGDIATGLRGVHVDLQVRVLGEDDAAFDDHRHVECRDLN